MHFLRRGLARGLSSHCQFHQRGQLLGVAALLSQCPVNFKFRARLQHLIAVFLAVLSVRKNWKVRCLDGLGQ